MNEVGYNKKFVQNVYIKDSDDERSIQYYFMPNTPMEIGVPVELLTNYKTAYESVRERKGYGLSNLQQGLKSDSCRATRLQRNFLEREDVALYHDGPFLPLIVMPGIAPDVLEQWPDRIGQRNDHEMVPNQFQSYCSDCS